MIVLWACATYHEIVHVKWIPIYVKFTSAHSHYMRKKVWALDRETFLLLSQTLTSLPLNRCQGSSDRFNCLFVCTEQIHMTVGCVCVRKRQERRDAWEGEEKRGQEGSKVTRRRDRGAIRETEIEKSLCESSTDQHSITEVLLGTLSRSRYRSLGLKCSVLAVWGMAWDSDTDWCNAHLDGQWLCLSPCYYHQIPQKKPFMGGRIVWVESSRGNSLTW